MNREINHNVFGKLYFEYGWVKDIEIEMMGKKREIQVVIDAEEYAEFDDIQIESYKYFFENINLRIKDAEEAIFNYYQLESSNYREQLNDIDIQKDVPEIENIKGLYNLVTPKQIIIPMIFDEDIREAGFVCECTWEKEHGIGVRFENEKVTEVGFQDVML